VNTVIRVEHLGKKYRLGGARERYGVLRESVARAASASFRRLLRRAAPEDDGPPADLWALRDVNVDVGEGEVVGIIGRNGAGKSTLLKIMSRITEPSVGSITMWGRVGSLLEVGTGFHPELTGRDNIMLSGAILGMSRAEILQRFDDIVLFAELAKFLDTPVKRYSSGMYVRLAFAVAAHLDPEILLIDEVLAVGDAAFQRKCLSRMTTLAKGGRTVLFVSHNLTSVANLCSRCVYLREGTIAFDGPVSEALAAYQEDLDASDGRLGSLRKRLSSDCAISGVRMLSLSGEPSRRVGARGGCVIEVALGDLRVDAARVRVEAWISPHGSFEKLLGFSSGDATAGRPAGDSRSFTCRFSVGDLRLSNGLYDLTVGCKVAGGWVDVIYQALTFQVGSDATEIVDGTMAAVVSDYDVLVSAADCEGTVEQ
jgi:ABC-type polysaccharide/polyol phosphate transport system ATPase subunit